jgi:hypothetical protein
MNPVTGCGLTLTIVHPTPSETIDTCSRDGTARYYDFQATVTGTATPTRVAFNWQDPTGAYAPPEYATTTAAPANVTVSGMTYTAHRQTGGAFNPALPEPLDIVGTHSSSIGTWFVQVTAQVGTCSVTASVPWALTHSRDTSCSYP